MKYNVTINNKVYEVEVEKGKANLVRTTDVVAAPAPAAAPAVAVQAGSTPVSSPMPGTILDIKVTVGQQVKEGDLVAILEAMKMENEIFASKTGSVAQIIAAKGSTVDTGDAIITIS